MSEAPDYKITKLEKGPLQRFKNQNLLLKKYGEVGLQLYKVITGKRTTAELRKDLGLEKDLFDQIISFMHDAGMVELAPVSGAKEPEEEPSGKVEALPDELPEDAPEPAPEEEGHEPEKEPSEEEPAPSKDAETFPEEDILPIEPLEDFEPSAPEEEEHEPGESSKPSGEEEGEEEPPEPETLSVQETPADDIEPISFEEEEPEEKPSPKKKPPEESAEDEDIEPLDFEPVEPPAGQEEKGPEISPYESWGQENAPAEEKSRSPVDKIIFDKYGDVGLKVYSLIDGQRTAEEIMSETGLTESKLVEILDFMDEQGIIKLDYPKQKPPPAEIDFPKAPEQKAPEHGKSDTFAPMTESEGAMAKMAAPVPDPIEVPKKSPLDFVKSVQMKAQLMLKYRDKGQKLYDLIDGENDVLDICLKLDVPLYELYTMLHFMLEHGMVLMPQATREQVRKKYGDDGFAVYKKYGREGLLLYELIGKELSMIQMAERITRDRQKVLEMFIFIHKVLGIELPIDKGVLAKQLGISG